MTDPNGSPAGGATAHDAAKDPANGAASGAGKDAVSGTAKDTAGGAARDAAPASDRPIVELREAGKSYGNIRALHGVNLTVHPGRVTCVLGDNGAGKSTLIKIISGLHQHTEGEFAVDGEPVRFTTPRDALAAGIA
ncbi:ATP-binding cassette domain-containing protein, partial [Streptomyces scabiei]